MNKQDFYPYLPDVNLTWFGTARVDDLGFGNELYTYATTRPLKLLDFGDAGDISGDKDVLAFIAFARANGYDKYDPKKDKHLKLVCDLGYDGFVDRMSINAKTAPGKYDVVLCGDTSRVLYQMARETTNSPKADAGDSKGAAAPAAAPAASSAPSTPSAAASAPPSPVTAMSYAGVTRPKLNELWIDQTHMLDANTAGAPAYSRGVDGLLYERMYHPGLGSYVWLPAISNFEERDATATMRGSVRGLTDEQKKGFMKQGKTGFYTQGADVSERCPSIQNASGKAIQIPCPGSGPANQTFDAYDAVFRAVALAVSGARSNFQRDMVNYTLPRGSKLVDYLCANILTKQQVDVCRHSDGHLSMTKLQAEWAQQLNGRTPSGHSSWNLNAPEWLAIMSQVLEEQFGITITFIVGSPSAPPMLYKSFSGSGGSDDPQRRGYCLLVRYGKSTNVWNLVGYRLKDGNASAFIYQYPELFKNVSWV